MIALRRENADLEAACEQAREELQMAVARAEKAEQQAAPDVCLSGSAGAGPDDRNRPKKLWPAVQDRPHSLRRSRNPVWQPETELEKLSVELLRRFDEMMQE